MNAAALEAIDWVDPPVLPLGDITPEHTALLKRKYGSVTEAARRLAHCHWILDNYARADPRLVHLSYELYDLLFLVVSQENSCRHCYGASRAFLRMMGYSEARVLELEADLHAVDLDPSTRLALDYARRLTRANPRPGPTEENALQDAGFSPEAIAELAVCTVSYTVGNRVATLSALAPTDFETLPDRWYAPVMRPLFRWMVGRDRSRGEPCHFAPGENTGPAAELLAAVDGSPSTHELKRTIDAAFASEVLPLRTKLLMTAVIARTLGCNAFEAGTIGLLEGMDLTASDTRRILDHLSSPKLTPVEAQLIPIARETVRYAKPSTVQRRMHELAEVLTPPELLEAIGICGLANALGRLSVLLRRC